MRVLFVVDGPEVPSSRFRVLQFLPHLAARNIEAEVRYGYGVDYNRVFQRRWAPLYKLGCRLRRAAHTMHPGSLEVVFLQKTAIPQTAIPESLCAGRGRRIIFDFDDAIFLDANGGPSGARRRAFERAVDLSSHIIAGNDYLAENAKAPGKTTTIPTVVDTSRLMPPTLPLDRRDLVLGWIGTASNFASLRVSLPSVHEVLKRFPRSILRIVSNARLPELDGVPRVEQIRWSPESELELLQSFDIGLMPLVDNAASRGKCALKMIQYMSVGCPVVASAVGVNTKVLAGTPAGLLVPPGRDFVDPLLTLLSDRELRRAMGERGRDHVVRHYSVEAVIDRLVSVIEGDGRP